MKSLKKTLVLLVVFAMILSTVAPAFAATTVATDTYGLDCEEEVARLQALKVVTGYDDGSYKPENTITRAEMAVILCKMVGIDDVTCNENKSVPSKFSDVAVNEWYTGYINVAAGKGFLNGFPDGTFRPNDQLTMNQVLTLCVNALGRGEYVATMGAWPANYITEATKLGLLDGVKTSDANRGNVAIIVWNTLEAPYVWDVTTTEYEGTINLGNSTRSLLSIYFRDYVFTELDGRAILGHPLKEVEFMTVSQVPATDGDLGEYQIKLVPEDPYAEGFIEAFDVRVPRNKDEKEWTTVDGDVITAYAPGFEDLDSYYGKIVTVIFGKDNVVVSIRVIDKTVDDETLASWTDNKLKIGGTSYKFADDAKVYINTKDVDDLADGEPEDNMVTVGDLLDDGTINGTANWNWKNFNKTIKTNVVLNNNKKVTRLDLFVSGDYADIETYEYVVTRTKNDVISLKSLNGIETEIDYNENAKYGDEDDQPRVTKDGKIIGLNEIKVGDVLTCYYDGNTIKTILVSSETKEGELTRTSKADFRMTLDGEKYYASMGETVGNFLFTENKLTDAEQKDDASKYLGEEVTIYLNVYGEYVLMSSDKEDADWIFGIITKVNDEKEDEEDEDLFYIPVRVLLADGSTSRAYQFVYDAENDPGTEAAWEAEVNALEGKFVVFSADSNSQIEYGDYAEAVVANLSDNADNATNKDFFATTASAANDVDKDRNKVEDDDGNKYTFGKDSVIFNKGGAGPNAKASVSKKFDILLDDDEIKFDAMIVYEKDSKTISYILINENEDNYAASDALYAVVAEDDYKEQVGSKTKRYVDLIAAGETEAEKIEAKNVDTEYVPNMEDMIVEYTLKSSKLDTAAMLIDLPEFNKDSFNDKDPVTNALIASGNETQLVVALVAAVEGADEVHGTVACPNAGDLEAVACDCTGFTAYVAAVPEHYEACESTDEGALHLVDGVAGANEIAVADANAARLPGAAEFIVGGYVKHFDAVAAVNAVHGTIACDGTCTAEARCTGYTAAVEAAEGTVKANFRVIDTDTLMIEFADDDSDNLTTTFGEVDVDKDVIVYDARTGVLVETTFAALVEEVEADEAPVYVVPYANEDAKGYGTADVEANILIIIR